MQESGERMQTLIDDLLAYSRTNTNGIVAVGNFITVDCGNRRADRDQIDADHIRSGHSIILNVHIAAVIMIDADCVLRTGWLRRNDIDQNFVLQDRA